MRRTTHGAFRRPLAFLLGHSSGEPTDWLATIVYLRAGSSIFGGGHGEGFGFGFGSPSSCAGVFAGVEEAGAGAGAWSGGVVGRVEFAEPDLSLSGTGSGRDSGRGDGACNFLCELSRARVLSRV